MGVPDVISWFDDFPEEGQEATNGYRFLSNFYVGTPIVVGPYTYLSGEHMFQAYKARTKTDHMMVVASATPGEAKANGKHMLRLRPDWERVKYDVMRLVLASKFTLLREEGRLLLATEDALLVEGTHWGDRVWGVDLKAGQERVREKSPHASFGEGEPWRWSPGRNWLGALLMVRRAELVAEMRGVPAFPYGEVARFAQDVPR